VADVVAQPAGLPARLRAYVSDSMAELKRVTWPDQPQVRSLSIGVVVLALAIGGLIALLDVVLQSLLVRGIPSLFGA
jgi:preprotein translocase SecE subunit